MFPLLLSVSHSLPLPLIVHPALFIEHWKLHYNNYRNGLHGHVYNSSKQNKQKIINKQRLCVVFVVIPVVPALCLSLISNNHFRYLLDLPRRFIRRRSSVPAHTHTQTIHNTLTVSISLRNFSLFLSAM
jgi:hypothetical protein